jgi:Uma2 family endonuclease
MAIAPRPEKPGRPVYYPETDGVPMAETGEQYNWIVKVKTNLHVLLSDAFVAGDLFWCPVEGNPGIVRAPDVMVALARTPGIRSSFLQWEEGGNGPEVVFEIWSPGNRFAEMIETFLFYQRYGVQEFIAWNSDGTNLVVYVREGNELRPADTAGGWTSPLLGVTFRMEDGGLVILDPSGRPFEEAEEILRRADRETIRANQEHARAEEERSRAEQERSRADEATRRAEALLARLKALGIEDP